jgi:hypothetical protein
LSVNLANWPELAELVRAWPTMPPDVRKLILGVLKLTPRPANAPAKSL